MALTPSIVQSGTNSRTTTADEFNQISTLALTPGVEGAIGYATPLTGDSAVQAQSSPNKTVKVLSGVVWMNVTPTAQAARTIRVPHSGLTSLTIADNTSGSTKYDKILIVLAADTLINPPASGDFAEATCIITERHNAANEAVTATNAIQLAEVTVANGFTTIANAQIADKRTHVSIVNSNLNGGWTTYTGTKTYASASTITVSSDATTIFPVGCKIRWKQGGDWKYAYVTTPAATLLTITGGTDYTVANAPIDVLEYSTGSSPVGFPLLNWTPTKANITKGAATETGKFWISGRTCNFIWKFVLAADSSIGTGPTITLPVPADTMYNFDGSTIGEGTGLDASTELYTITLGWTSGVTYVLKAQGTGGAYGTNPGATATAPFSWGTADTIWIKGSYLI